MTDQRLTILILGGYGTFGGRLARLLDDDARLTLIVAGRSREKSAAFIATLPGRATKIAAAIDREGDLKAQIAAFQPDLVVDASGPFQAYGTDPYRVVGTCLALGICYTDLADGSAFVNGIGQFEEPARARGIFVLAGASSFPVLTVAVIRHLSRDLTRIDSVTGGIAPSPYAGVGLNVIRAIAGYAGQPILLVRDGRPQRGYPFTETKRYTVAPPGRLPLHNIRFSLVDVPDLRVLPVLWPEVQSVWIGAGPVPEILHRALSVLAWLVRLKLLPSLLPLARVFHLVSNILRWGEHRGGMFVAIGGSDSTGQPIERSWHLLAEGDDGPFIPSVAVQGLVLRWLAGDRPKAGARPATGDLEIDDYARLFANRTIFTGYRQDWPVNESQPVHQRVLGEAWRLLPDPIRIMHDCRDELRAAGVAQIDRGTGLLSRLVATLIGFPAAGNDVPVTVTFRRNNEREIWTRRFGAKSFSSVQSPGRGRSQRLLSERFGPLTFDMALVINDARRRMDLIVRRMQLLGLPLPACFLPRAVAYETADDGRFNFHVEIAHPLCGLIVRYRGWLEPIASAAS